MPTASILIKPEGTAMFAEFQEGLDFVGLQNNHDLTVRDIITKSKSAVTCLIYGAGESIGAELVRVETGIISPMLMTAAYPESCQLSREIREKMELAYIGNPYALLTFSCTASDDLLKKLQAIKGKMSGIDPHSGRGLRGYLLSRIVQDNLCYSWDKYSDAWLQTGNFLHIPDSAEEHSILHNYLSDPTRSDNPNVLLDSSKKQASTTLAFRSIWDVYKILDQSIFLSAERTEKEKRFLKNIFSIEDFPRLIDIACGYGRIANNLAKDGYDVYGFDADGGEIGKARRIAQESQLKNVRFEVGTYSSFQTFERQFDGAYMAYGVFNTISDKEIAGLLNRVRDSLRKGGRLVIDLLNKNHVLKTSNGQPIKMSEKVSGLNATRERSVSASGDLEVTRFRIQNGSKEEEYIYRQRLFDLEEMIRFIEDAGYNVIGKFGDFNGGIWTLSSSRMVLVAEKL